MCIRDRPSPPYPEEIMCHNAGKGHQHEEYTRQKGFPGGIYMDEASGGMQVRENIIYQTVVPIHYHNIMQEKRFQTNQINKNTINKKPCDYGYQMCIRDRMDITGSQCRMRRIFAMELYEPRRPGWQLADD